MKKTEPQHGQTQNRPAAKQAKAASVKSRQGEHVVQLETMMESSPQAEKLGGQAAMMNNGPQSQKLAGLAATMNNSPAMVAQRKLFDRIHNSPLQVAQKKAFDAIHNSPRQVAQKKKFGNLFGVTQRVEDEEPLTGKFEPVQRVGEEEPLQGKFEAVQRVTEEEPLQGKFTAQSPAQLAPAQLEQHPAQREAAENKPNNTGLPDNLKSGIENLSGMSMDNVKVHYNSSQPAQLNALAYAQGTDIHVAPGQEQHLPHEAWHVVQQAQGRVRPTMQMKNDVPVNDDRGLEHEADVMGGRAAVRYEANQDAGGISRSPATLGAVMQLVKINGKDLDKETTKFILKQKGNVTLKFTMQNSEIGKNGILANCINQAALATKLQTTLGLKKVPSFIIRGNGINTFGDHTLEFGKTVIFIKVERESPEPRDEEKENRETYTKKKDIEEPEATSEESPAGMLFGTEFTFSNDAMFQEAKEYSQDGVQATYTPENIRIQKEWMKLLLGSESADLLHFEEQKDDKNNPSIKFTYKDGWWYKCSLDVACIETQTYKMSLRDAEEKGWLKRIETDIFGIAQKLGLSTHKDIGGGHLHLDVESTFGNNQKLFREFLVDFCNNPLALEVLENDPTNSPVLGQLKESIRGEFNSVIKNFDNSMEVFKGTGENAIIQLACSIQKCVYKQAFSHLNIRDQLDPPEKYQALNFTRIASPDVEKQDKTLEMRSIRAQRSVDEFVLIAKLLRARIAMLKQQLEKGGSPTQYQKEAKLNGTPHSDPQQVFDAFKVYVEKAGLAWEHYELLAIANLQERHKDFKPKKISDNEKESETLSTQEELKLTEKIDEKNDESFNPKESIQ